MTADDARSIAPRLRQEDREELHDALPGLSAEDALKLACEQSAIALAWESNGVPIAVGGVINRGDRVGNGWMLATPEAFVSPRLIHRVATQFLVACGEHWSALAAESRADLESHHRWLTHLGFEKMAAVNGYIYFGFYFD